HGGPLHGRDAQRAGGPLMLGRSTSARPITGARSGRRPIIAIFLTFAVISAATIVLSVHTTKGTKHRSTVIQASAAAPLGGVTAPAVNGDDDETVLPPAEDAAIQRQFALDQRLVADLTGTGEALLAHRPTTGLPETAGEHVSTLDPLARLRVLAALTSSIAF